jgi:hypothetical protein
MLLSRSPSNTSALVLVSGLVSGLVCSGLAGCGGSDDSCGPSGAPTTGLTATGTGATLTYGGLSASPNGDCPVGSAPKGVTSLTISGTQTDGDGLITLCVGRPDLFAHGTQTLGTTTAEGRIQVIDLGGTSNSCSFAFDAAQEPTGTATTTGMCGNGTDASGFSLVLDASLTMTRTCGQVVDSVVVSLRGRVAVTAATR